MFRRFAPWVAMLAGTLLCGCDDRGPHRLRIGVAFETLQTEYWVASFEALKAELQRRDIEMIEAIREDVATASVPGCRLMV